MSKISVNNAWFYSYHGCLSEETIVGGEYLVNATVELDTSKAETDDSLENTVDYVDVYNAIKKEMDTPSKLLEVVMERIISSINKLDKNIVSVDVSIKKVNPPIGGCVDKVEIRKNL